MTKTENEKEKECIREEHKKTKSQNEKIKEKKCSCEDCKCEEPENYLELAQRIQAEFDNYRKRSSDIVRIARQDGIIDAVLKFLPSLDAVQKAKTMIKDSSVLEGLDLIEREMKKSLKNLDIEEIESQGQHFDPKYHNVVAVKKNNSLDDGIIVEVYQAGYKIKDRIIRYAQVVVNKNKEE